MLNSENIILENLRCWKPKTVSYQLLSYMRGTEAVVLPVVMFTTVINNILTASRQNI